MHVSLSSPVFPLQRTAWFPLSYAGRHWPYRGPWSLMMPAVKVTFPDTGGQLLFPHSNPLASVSFLTYLEESSATLGLELSPRSPPGSTPMTTQRSSPWVLPVPFRNTYNITQLTLCFALSVNYPCHWNISSARAGHCLFCSLSFPYLPALHWHPDVSLIALFNKYERNHKCYKYLLWEIRVCYFALNRSWT